LRQFPKTFCQILKSIVCYLRRTINSINHLWFKSSDYLRSSAKDCKEVCIFRHFVKSLSPFFVNCQRLFNEKVEFAAYWPRSRESFFKEVCFVKIEWNLLKPPELLFLFELVQITWFDESISKCSWQSLPSDWKSLDLLLGPEIQTNCLWSHFIWFPISIVSLNSSSKVTSF